MDNYIQTQYQGKEFTAVLQAPTEATLNTMLGVMADYGRRFKMGHIKVTERGEDPDGGYRAIVTAHNFNPRRWLKRQAEKRGQSSSEKIRLEHYYHREDVVRKAIQKQNKERRRQDALAEVKYKADMEEQRERTERAKAGKRALKRTGRMFSPYVYAGEGVALKHPVTRSRTPRISKRTPRLR